MKQGLTKVENAYPAISSESVFQEFISYCEVKKTTLEGYKKAIKRFYLYLSNNHIDAPSREDLRNYRNELIATMRPASVQYYVSVLRIFFGWLSSEGRYPDIAEHFKSGVKVDRLHKRTGLNERQIATILNGIDRKTPEGKRNYALFLLMYLGGFRVIEMVRANIEDLEIFDGVARLNYQGKGRDEKAESKIVPNVALKALNAYLKTRQTQTKASPLFASLANRSFGKRLTNRSISRIIKTILISTGFDSSKIVAHSLRKSAITNARLLGADISEAQKFAGHSSPVTTQIYDDSQENRTNRCPELLSNSLSKFLTASL